MTKTIRAAIYGRLSQDRTGEGVAVDRQLQDCRDLAARRGWEVAREFRDDSKSAWRRDRKRPGWDALLEAIAAGEVQAVIVWHGDRLMRQPFDLERLIGLVEDKGLLIASPSGERDLGKPDDRFILRIEVAAQCRESDSTSRRIRRVRQEEAATGKRNGPVPFGWRTDEEADIVRGMVRGFLAGRSLRSITMELNAAGIPAPRGGKWAGTHTRLVVERWANAGLRVHKGAVTSTGQWPALVTRDEQEAVVRLLAAPGRQTNAGTHRVHLLSGVATCAVCSGPLRGSMRRGTRRIYRCMGGHVVVGADWLDGLVLELAQRRITGIKPARAGDPEADARHALAALRIRKEAAAEAFADGAMDAAQLRAVNARLDSRIAAAEEALRAVERRSRVDADAVLADLGQEQQRDVLRVLFERIEIRPTGTNRLDPGRVVPVWAGAEE